MVEGGKITASRGEETATALRRNAQDLGVLGGIFGSKGNAPTNIAGATVIMLFLVLAVVVIAPLDSHVDRNDLIKALLAAIASSLAYLFGAASARR
jgi:hypothetical protein